MTVSSTPNTTISYAGDGSTLAFPYTMRIPAADTLVVELLNASGVVTKTYLTSEYTVTGIDPLTSGGTVTLTTTAPAVGETLRLRRVMPYEQTLDIPNNGDFYPEEIEKQFDYTVLQTQQLANETARAPKVALGSTAPDIGAVADGEVVGQVNGEWIGVENDPASAADSAAAAAASAAAGLVSETNSAASASSSEGFKEQAGLYAGQALAGSLANEGSYPNDYDAVLPKGVTLITVSNAGSGYTDGTYAGGVSGGPTGFAWTYTVVSGVVASTAITNAGLATATTLPTLSFPSGGGASAAATATVASIIPDQDSYWAASSDGLTIGLTKNEAGSPADVDNPSAGGRIRLPQATLVEQTIAAGKPYIVAPSSASALYRLVEVNLFLEAGGITLTWPDKIQVRELAGDGSNRMRFRLGGGTVLDGDSAYDEIGSESTGGQLNRAYGTLSVNDSLEIYATDTSLGVPVDTVIGHYRVAFDGTTFGTYYPFAVFTYAAGGLTNNRILPSAVEQLNTKALVAEVRREVPTSSPWVSTVTDPYGIAFVEDVAIECGIADRTYILRYRHDTAGSTRRLHMFLYDPVIGQDIADFTKEDTSDFSASLHECVVLTGVSLGGPDTNFTGTSATVWIDKTKINFDGHITTTETDTAVAGIKPDRVLPREVVAEMIRTGRGIRNHELYAGPEADHDFTSIKLAQESLMIDTSAPRSGFPFSDFVSPSNQYAIKMEPGYTEEWTEHVVDQGGGLMIAQGIILWAGLSIELNEGCVFHTTGGATYTGPLFEASYGGRITGPTSAKLQQRGEGYVGHIDGGNTISKPAQVGVTAQFWQLVFMFDGPELESTLEAHDDPIMGCGWSDDQDVTFMRGKMTRHEDSVTTTGYYFSHTSASSILQGRALFDRMRFNDDVVTTAPAISLAKNTGGRDDAQVVRHAIELIDCRIADISSDDKWVGLGGLSGASVSPSGILD